MYVVASACIPKRKHVLSFSISNNLQVCLRRKVARIQMSNLAENIKIVDSPVLSAIAR